MRPLVAALAGSVVTIAIAVGAGAVYVVSTGLHAAPQPPAVEAALARRVRRLAVSRADAARRNPVTASSERLPEGPSDGLSEGLSHYADHCASCHAIDGSGDTELGRGLYPKAPDMRLDATQDLSDGELFAVIEHGVRFTGMPAWSTGTAAGETASWQLVLAIRHLPRLTDDEKARMQTQLPRSPEAIRQEIEEEAFLNGGDVPSPSPVH